MDDASVLPSWITAASIIMAGVVGALLLVIAGVLISRWVRGLPAGEVHPDRTVSAPVVLILLCLCVPFALIAWFPLWLFRVQRSDGSAWSVPWKLAYTISPVLPLMAVVVVLSRLGYPGGGQTFLSLLSPVGPLLVATADVVSHRRA